MKEMKRILSIFLCLVMLVGVLPVSALATDMGGFVIPGGDKTVSEDENLGGFIIPGGKTEAEETTAPAEEEATAPSTEAATEPTVVTEELEEEAEQLDAGEKVVVIAGSDYQDRSSSTNMKAIMNQIKDDYGAAYGALMGGDYNGGSATWTTAALIEKVDDDIDAVFSGIAAANRIYVQGNHDRDLSPSSTSNLLSKEGAHDTDYYGVYVINQEDFPWNHNSNPAPSESLVQGTADLLGDYLEAKVAEGYKKPIFVVTHLPLHTTSRGDSMYARLIYNELEAAGEAGLNIIFLFGHNHSGGYDAYLGNGSIYLPKGSPLTVVDGKSGTYTDSSISFTYANYGYVGYVGGSSCTHLTMTAFVISDNQVVVKRYDTSGQHLLKEKGATVSGYNTDANEYGQAVIDLSTGLSTISEVGADIEDVVPGVTVENADKTVSVTAPNLTGLTATKSFGTADTDKYDAETYGAYASYDIVPAGYTQGDTATVTITLDAADNFDASKKVYVIDGEKKTEYSIVNGKVTFTTNHFSTYAIAQAAAPAAVTGNVYTLDTDGVSTGEDYLIVSTGTDGTAYALRNNGGSVARAEVTISNGQIVTDAEDIVWTYDDEKYLSNNAQYIYLTSNNRISFDADEPRAMTITSNSAGEGAYTVKRDGNYNYYLNYSSQNWTCGSSADDIYFFVRTSGTGTGGGSTGGGSTVTPSGGDWVTISDGKGKIVYKLDTDGVDAGSKYLIVSDDEAVAMSAAANSNNSVSIEFNSDETEAYPTSTDYEWTIATSGSGYKMYNADDDYIGRSSSSISNDNSDVWTITGNGEGAYTIKTGSYVLRYSGSNSAFRVGSSNTYSYAVRLYKYDHTDTSTAEYAKIDGELSYTVARGATAEEALAKVKESINVLTSANADGSNPTTLDDDDENITWTLDSSYGEGTVPGEYAVTITYKGKTLGVAKVIVPEATIEGYDCDESGAVIKGASKSAKTGAYITVDVKDDEGEDFTVPVTVGMLFNADGTAVSTAEIGTYTGLTVKYNGVVITENFTLVVNPKNDNPTYPDEGAVKVSKSATGIDFQASGTATVELSASGIPMSEGIDVVIVLDTSSSMTRDKFPDQDGNKKTRIELLRPAVDSLIQQMQTKREDGSDPQIDIAIVGFNANTMATGDNYISDEGNDPSYDQTAKYGILTKNSDGGAWVEIMDLDSDWGTQNSGANIPTGSGTNYDYGLQTAYDLLNQKKIDEGGARQQFVLFLSDGAPYQFNGVYSNGGESEWINWVLGNYTYTKNEDGTVTTTIPDTVSNPEFYGGYANGAGQEHRIAEAIKGDVDSSFDVVKFDSSSKGYIDSVPGLGATIYTLGLLLADESNNITAENQDTVLRKIASSGADGAKLHYEVDSVTDLAGAFDDFATAVLLAATNARFTDEMGEKYNLQLTPVDYLPTGETTDYSTINPVLEIRSYEIYTRAELEEADGSLTEANAKLVGTRKTNDEGKYIFETLETITFQYTKNGTNDYTLTGATSDQLGDTNILNDGVIRGKYIWYNTNKNANASDTSGDRTLDLDGDGAADDVLTAETFYWNIGDIRTTELALRYNVHLDGSLAGEGGREAGSYDTNGDAILYYDNYLGNPWQKEALTPSLAWQGANVSYAFYLVDASSGKPVNNDGVEVPFSNRTVIVDRTLYDEILLNNETGVIRPMSIAASGVLPAGYWLYDETASYTVTVNSNGTGNWVITGDSTLKNPSSTYVKDYHGDEFTNENFGSSTHPDYDYTHTTVWFAVKWEPQAVPDTVVVDYGLPVDVHVLTNDMFGKYGKLIGVRPMEDGETTEPKKGEAFNSQEAQGTFGNAKLDVPATGYTDANSVITYTMETMGMNTFERFAYCVQYANPVESKNDGCYYGYLTVIPATTIYYEDDFVDLSSETWDYNADPQGWVDNGVSGWTIPEKQEITQDEDRPGDINYAFDTVIDANNVYGYDSAYAECSTYSLDQAAKAIVDYDNRAKASFTFWGTGFDVISATSTDTGTIVVDVFKAGTSEKVHSYVVDTYYGYVMTENKNPTEENPGKWEFALKQDASALYQVPVIKVSGLTYGQYDVVITAQYSTPFDHEKDGAYDFYLDAIRIYDPAGPADQVVDDKGTENTEDDITIGDIYEQDGEAFPVYQELRNNILNKSDVENGIPGAVFIDGIGETASVDDYKEYGPNNEVYLNPGQAILFTTSLGDAADKLASLQIGLKAETQTAATYYIFDAATITGSADLKTLKPATVLTATDMYYDITALAGKNIVIYNSGDGILSITNLKATFTEDSGLKGILNVVNKADVEDLLNALNDGAAETGSETVTEENLTEIIKKIVGRLKGLLGKG